MRRVLGLAGVQVARCSWSRETPSVSAARVQVQAVAALVLHLGHQDGLALQRRRARDPVAFGQHADDLRVRVLRDLADQRAAIGVGHPVLGLDLDVGVDARLERALLVRHVRVGADPGHARSRPAARTSRPPPAPCERRIISIQFSDASTGMWLGSAATPTYRQVPAVPEPAAIRRWIARTLRGAIRRAPSR